MAITLSFVRIRKMFGVHAKEFRRDFGAVFFSFVFPLFFVLLLVISSLAAPEFKFEFGLVDPQGNALARKLAEALASDYMQVRTVSRTQAEAELKEGKLQAVVVLPAADMDAGGEIELIASERYQGFARIAMEAAFSRLQNNGAGSSRYNLRMLSPRDQVNSEFAFMFPGMLALALLQLGLFATAVPLLRARERGTLRHLLLTPLQVMELLISQISFRLLVALTQMGVLLVAGMFAVELAFVQWLAVMTIAFLGAAMLICIGYALAGLAPSLEGGMALIMIVNFAMLFGGNIFSDPSGSLGLWIIAHFLPVSYLADAFRQVINQSVGLWPIWLDLSALLVWSSVAVLIANRTFRFDMGSQDSPKMPEISIEK